MPRSKRKQQHGGKKNRSAREEKGYTGPIFIGRPRSAQPRTTTENLIYTAPLASNAVGTIDGVFNNGPLLGSATDWSNFAGAYHEYRVLAMQLDFLPNNQYSKTTTTCAPIAAVIDRTGSTLVIGNWAAAVGHDSVTFLTLENRWKKPWCLPPIWRANGNEEMQWNETSSLMTTGLIKLYSENNTATTTFGRIILTFVVQFRNRY